MEMFRVEVFKWKCVNGNVQMELLRWKINGGVGMEMF
jgi:hypothetical protein